MIQNNGLQSGVNTTESTLLHRHAMEQTSVPVLVSSPSPFRSRRRWLMSGAVGALVLCVVTLVVIYRPGAARQVAAGTSASAREEADANRLATIPVNTIRPQRKTLERTLVQPGSIQPWAQAELYAKTSGYLKCIRRTLTPEVAADLLTQLLAASGPPSISLARLAIAAEVAFRNAPQIDIGSRVRTGDLLLEIATPERLQEIVEKESLVQQRQAELEAARTALVTHEAAVEAAKAQVRKSASEHAFRAGELKRLKELVQSRTVQQEIADEKLNQVNAVLAAWDSSQADLAVISSKLATARADLKVKEALVQVAKDQLGSARVLAAYSQIRAPFEGIITYRGVDEGDFVQNATSGQARRLMTVTAMDRVRIVLQVPERDAPWVQTGADATIVVDARSTWQVKGHVTRLAQSLEPQTRTMQVEIDLDNDDHQLRPGMYGHVTLTLQKIANAQAIPAAALFAQKGENFIFQVQDGVAKRHRVLVRYDDGKELEVVKLLGGKMVALDGTEELIVSNKGEIAEGQRVRTAPLSRQ